MRHAHSTVKPSTSAVSATHQHSEASTNERLVQSFLMRTVVSAVALAMGLAVLGLSDAHAQETPKYGIHVGNMPYEIKPLGGTGAPVQSDLVDGHKANAVTGQLADVSSTGIGLAMGAAEANPLGLVTLGVKAAMYQRIQEAPATEQPRMWGVYGAFGWGAAANNLCVIAAIATGGAAAALCPVIGLATGVSVWNSNEEERNHATFDAICKEMQATNPQIQCIYNPKVPVANTNEHRSAPVATSLPHDNPTMVQHQSTYGEAGG